MTSRTVIVGINDYRKQFLSPGWTVGNLAECVNDARSMRDLLTNSSWFPAALLNQPLLAGRSMSLTVPAGFDQVIDRTLTTLLARSILASSNRYITIDTQ